jgi:hypothetical protein
MALTYKIQDDGTPQPMGDTQGILIPKGCRYCLATAVKPESGTLLSQTWTYLPLAYASGENWINSDGNIVVPKTDALYLFRGRFSTGDNRRKLLAVPMGVSYMDDPSFSVSACSAGLITTNPIVNVFRIWVNGNIPWSSIEGQELLIVLLEQSVSDIVANKGALVSGKSFQFDTDGNGYTENYPPVGEDWKVGIYGDGSEVRRTVKAIANPTSWASASFINLGIPAPAGFISVVDYFITMKSTDTLYDTTLTPRFNEIRLGKIANGNLGGYLASSIGSMVANSATLYLTYCKTPGA